MVTTTGRSIPAIRESLFENLKRLSEQSGELIDNINGLVDKNRPGIEEATLKASQDFDDLVKTKDGDQKVFNFEELKALNLRDLHAERTISLGVLDDADRLKNRIAGQVPYLTKDHESILTGQAMVKMPWWLEHQQF